MYDLSKLALSPLADSWDQYRKQSDKVLDDFVDAHPHLWGLAFLTSTAMDIGAGTVDLLRFGEGAAKSQETGTIGPLLQDVLRGASIGLEVGGFAQEVRPFLGRQLRLFSDPGGHLCVPVSIGNALRRTGQRLLVPLEDIISASPLKLWQIKEAKGLTDPQMLTTLRRLGAKFEVIQQAQSFENLVAIAKKADGVVSLPLSSAKGGHMALLERYGGSVRIVDRDGFYNSLSELSKAYDRTFTVDSAGIAVIVKNVTARLVKGVGTLMVYCNAISVKLNGKTAVRQRFPVRGH